MLLCAADGLPTSDLEIFNPSLGTSFAFRSIVQGGLLLANNGSAGSVKTGVALGGKVRPKNNLPCVGDNDVPGSEPFSMCSLSLPDVPIRSSSDSGTERDIPATETPITTSNRKIRCRACKRKASANEVLYRIDRSWVCREHMGKSREDVSKTQSRASLPEPSPTTRKIVRAGPGLVNHGNPCYINSTIQVCSWFLPAVVERWMSVTTWYMVCNEWYMVYDE